jgi:hypothetical protein
MKYIYILLCLWFCIDAYASEFLDNDDRSALFVRIESSPCRDLDISERDVNDIKVYGAVEAHPVSGLGAVFVTTYNLIPLSILQSSVMRLYDDGQHQRYVVVQMGGGTRDGGSPYLLRPHPLIWLGDSTGETNVILSIQNASPGIDGIPISLLGHTHKCHTHSITFPLGITFPPGITFSPNNMHFQHLPSDEIEPVTDYSFVSHVTGNEKSIKTFHWLIGQDLVDLIGRINRDADVRDVRAFMRRLVEEVDDERLETLEKMFKFITGEL